MEAVPPRVEATPPPSCRMSDGEALMWTLEKDPRLSAVFANLTFLDRPPDPRRLRDRLSLAVAAVPRLRQRAAPSIGRLAPPAWREDPSFDLEWHLREIAVPAPGTDDQVLELAAAITADRLDRTRPLWQFVVIEGLQGGRTAMLQKLHHTVTDGVGGVRMSAQFLDLERDAESPLAAVEAGSPLDADEAESPLDADGPAPAGGGGAPPEESVTSNLLDAAAHDLRRALGIAARLAGGATALAAHPARIPEAGAEVAATARSVARLGVVPDRARSPLWTERSLRRGLLTLSAPLAQAKEAAGALGGTINDLFVTAAAGAAGAYHRKRGMPVAELRMAMPVSTRRDRSVAGNAFAPTRVLVPVGIEDPVARFAAVRERLEATRKERWLGAVEGFAGLVNLLPTSLLVRLALQEVRSVDFTASNVRGAPVELYLAGARIDANCPIGPLGCTAFNLTLLSYAGRLDMGLHVDLAAVAEPAALRDDIESSFSELLAAGRPRRPGRSRAGSRPARQN